MNAKVVPAGQQRGSSRYGPRFEGAPNIANWRANLTGLSQNHNLYFIAYGADIHVYEPQFPTQELANNALLIFTSQPSASRLVGYIDRRRPHQINNLVIDFLGHEEVIAVVRDDGDVDAFLVRHIVQAIERRSDASNTLGPQATEVRPFFQNNVSMSAWGLAIHAEARIIATSSNAHEVRIFKFGLAQTDNEDGSASSSSEKSSPEHQGNADTGTERHSDVRHDIINGESNIPYIAFCNTGDDPEGRWLLTTDISGVCRVMDLRELKTSQAFQFGHLLRDQGLAGFDRIHAGWILMFLDRRSFHDTEDVCNALGLEDNESISALGRTPWVWDLSKTVQRLPGHKQPFIYHKIRKHRRSSSSGVFSNSAAADSAVSEADEYDDSMNEESDGGAPLQSDMETFDASAHNEQTNEIPVSIDSASSVDSSTSDQSSINVIDDAEDPDDEMTEDVISFNDWYNGDTVSYNLPHYATSNLVCDGLPCPILHASFRNIYLLQPTDERTAPGARTDPMVGLANPLRQNVQQDFEFLSHHQRLNMAVFLPPLGVVVVASQKGRAMVLSLSKFPARTAYPPEMLPKEYPSGSSNPSWTERTTYAMRIECILPFAEQEKANQRPFMPLHGLAASPLQGCELDPVKGTSMRWRLMMMYQDHSILSYEISCSKAVGGKTESSGVGVKLESVIV